MMSVFGVGIFAPAPKKRWCAPNLSGAHHFFRIRFAVVRGGEVWRLLHVLPAAADDDALLSLVQQLTLQVVDALDALR